MIGIYKITSPSGRIYIGSSINIERRFKQYLRLKSSKGQLRLNRSFIKYTIEAHKFEIIEECNIIDLYRLENYYATLYNSLSIENLNLSIPKLDSEYGGHSQETKDKISRSNKGKIFTDTHRENISISKKITSIGENNSFFGKKHTEEFKKNRSISRMGGGNPNSKLVLDIINGIYYLSLIEAALVLKINRCTLASKLRGNILNNTNLIYC